MVSSQFLLGVLLGIPIGVLVYGLAQTVAASMKLPVTEDGLRARVTLVAGVFLILTAVMLADPLRLYPDTHATDTLTGLLLAAGLVAIGVKGIEQVLNRRSGSS